MRVVSNFRDIMFPIMWIQEGVAEVTVPIQRWVYLATSVADVAVPFLSYGCIVLGAFILLLVFIKAYRNFVFSDETIEKGKERITRELREFRRGSGLCAPLQSGSRYGQSTECERPRL